MTPINALAPDDGYGKRPLSWVDTVFIHHDAGKFDADWREVRERQRIDSVRMSHQSQGWPNIAYHLYVFPSGRVYQTGALDTIRYHTAGPDDYRTPQVISRYNEHGIALCFSGLFVDGAEPTAAALAGAREVIRWCEEQVSWPLAVLGHQDVYATTCPGTNWHEWRNELLEEKEEEPTMDTEKLTKALDAAWDVRKVLTGIDDATAAQSLVATLQIIAETLIALQHPEQANTLSTVITLAKLQGADLLQAIIEAKEATGLQ